MATDPENLHPPPSEPVDRDDHHHTRDDHDQVGEVNDDHQTNKHCPSDQNDQTCLEKDPSDHSHQCDQSDQSDQSDQCDQPCNTELSVQAKLSLARQNSRLVSEFRAGKLELEAQRNWDLFYKRNETNFFKDRHWSTREFQELLGDGDEAEAEKGALVLLEVGCGVGNFAFPLLEELGERLYIHCCDFSPRGVQFVRDHKLYDESRIRAFQCDITTPMLEAELGEASVDIVSCIFVLSAIHPDKHGTVFHHLAKVLRPGGKILFRDYAVNDMAMLRFGPGSKIAEHFYSRQDGTRSYFFTEQEISSLAASAGLEVCQSGPVARRTVNKKEGLDVGRIFIQAKLRKPL